MDGDKKSDQNGQGQQAGWVFKPGGEAAPPQPPAPVEQQAPAQPQASAPVPTQAAAPAAPQQAAPVADNRPSVEWTGSEFIAHQKNVKWYLLFALAALLTAVFVYLVTKDTVSAVVIGIVAILFGIAAGHKPRVMAYRLDSSGLTIGKKFYPYADFKAFAIVDEGAFESIAFIPQKKFLPNLNIYVPPENGDRILEVLSAYLPMEQRKQGLVDSAARRMRF